MSSMRRSRIEVWRWPIVVAILTTAGLLSALLGQRGAWLPISWTLLAIPLVVIFGFLFRGASRPRP
jgi:hypothetical protein